MDGATFAGFIEQSLLPILNPFNHVNPLSVVLMDNASIHHVDQVSYLIEEQAGARLFSSTIFTGSESMRGCLQSNQKHDERFS